MRKGRKARKAICALPVFLSISIWAYFNYELSSCRFFSDRKGAKDAENRECEKKYLCALRAFAVKFFFKCVTPINIKYQKKKAMYYIVEGTDRLNNTIRLGTHYAMMLNSRDDTDQIIKTKRHFQRNYPKLRFIHICR